MKEAVIVNLPLKDIKQYANNPRNNKDAVQYVANSIKEFGFRVPIILDRDGVIIAGHTRYKAAQKLKLKAVPCIYADDLTEQQVRAYRLADNKTQELADWNIDALADELELINGIDMAEFGFLDFLEDEEQEEAETQQQFTAENKEYDVEEFSDEQFGTVCPCCGFRYNEE